MKSLFKRMVDLLQVAADGASILEDAKIMLAEIGQRYVKPVAITTVEGEASGKTGLRLTERHPAFASIRLTRREGGAVLFGSEFKHQRYVAIEISRAENIRESGHERVMPIFDASVVTVLLSQDQFASFLSSMNFNEGTRCTIADENGIAAPRIVPPQALKDRFAADATHRFHEAVSEIDQLIADLPVSMKGATKKAQEAMLEKLTSARRKIVSEVPFLAGLFDEHMEETLAKARMELYGMQREIGLPVSDVGLIGNK